MISSRLVNCSLVENIAEDHYRFRDSLAVVVIEKWLAIITVKGFIQIHTITGHRISSLNIVTKFKVAV